MTPSQQAALEQVAREWLMNNEIAHWGGRTSALVTLLAAQRAVVLEEVIKEIENTRAVVAGSTLPLSSVLADIIRWLNELAQEQRP